MASETEIHGDPAKESLSLPQEGEADDLEFKKPAEDRIVEAEDALAAIQKDMKPPVTPPYVKPPWSAPPEHPFFFEVIREGSTVATLDVSVKPAYMFGRSDTCDFVLEHPTSSRFHAVLQYREGGGISIYDNGSTHGTFVNKNQAGLLRKSISQYELEMFYASATMLAIDLQLEWRSSSRLYIFQGPSELMPEEASPKSHQVSSRARELALERKEKAESLRRAKAAAVAAEGISWGMKEDAEEEEEEENLDEVTWRTHKGQLTEKQQKTLEKVQKRNEKLANLKKEIDSIQAKEIAQGGLTQGQQTQIARNEQRIEQLMEELDSLEETLNDSIRESLGARTRKAEFGKRPGFLDEDDDNNSSDDEFYNRATKSKDKKKHGGTEQQVETAESLLEKRFSIDQAVEKAKAEIEAEEKKKVGAEESSVKLDSVDPLDAFMTNVSKDMKMDRTARLTKRLETLNAEKERLVRLLKIADPTQEALRKWEVKSKSLEVEQTGSIASIVASRAVRVAVSRLPGKASVPGGLKSLVQKQPGEIVEERNKGASEQSKDAGPQLEVDAKVKESEIPKSEIKALEPPLWLGAPKRKEKSDPAEVEIEEADAPGDFLEYKDRQKGNVGLGSETLLPAEPSGLVLRSPPVAAEIGECHQATATVINDEAQDAAAADAVALLLRHKGGLASAVAAEEKRGRGEKNRKKRKVTKVQVAGDGETEYEGWVPPKGQTGDGKTSLNDKFGY